MDELKDELDDYGTMGTRVNQNAMVNQNDGMNDAVRGRWRQHRKRVDRQDIATGTRAVREGVKNIREGVTTRPEVAWDKKVL